MSAGRNLRLRLQSHYYSLDESESNRLTRIRTADEHILASVITTAGIVYGPTWSKHLALLRIHVSIESDADS